MGKIGKRLPNNLAALIVASLSSFIVPFMSASINVALPLIGQEFKLNAIMLDWVSTSFLLTLAMFLIPLSKVADIYGRKRIFLYGSLIVTIVSLLTGLADSALMLLVCRVALGIGAAMVFATSMAILTAVVPAHERGKSLGIAIATVYLGLSLGPVFGGFSTQFFGWRSIFFINVPLGLLLMYFTIWHLEGEWREAKEEKLDLFGSLVYCLALAALMYGLSILPSWTGWALVLGGGVGLSLFAYLELHKTSPLLNVRLFVNNRAFALANLAALINYSATFAVGFLISLYLQYIKGFPPATAGLILISQPIVMAVLSPFAGRLSDRIEPRFLATSGMAITVIGLLMLLGLNEQTSITFLMFSLAFLGLGFALFSSPNTNIVMSSVDHRQLGIASSMLATMRSIGQMTSMGISLLIFAIFIGQVQIAPANFGAFLAALRALFGVFSVLCLIGVGASLVKR